MQNSCEETRIVEGTRTQSISLELYEERRRVEGQG